MKKSTYEMVTERIIEQLEQGTIPWIKPWTGTARTWSRATGKPYSIINQMLLMEKGEYATFNQIKKDGGKVRKGEKGKKVVFFKPFKIKEKVDGEEIERTIPLLREYTVFNINQCDGISEKYHYNDVKRNNEPLVECENTLNEYLHREKVKFCTIEQDRAFYQPSNDSITLPLLEQFDNTESYYCTAFHEVAHSTGHKKRLNRIKNCASFGSTEYSKEELIAEITSSAILNTLGIETDKTFKNTTAYIKSWLKALKNDTKMIVHASTKADKAYNMIMGIDR